MNYILNNKGGWKETLLWRLYVCMGVFVLGFFVWWVLSWGFLSWGVLSRSRLQVGEKVFWSLRVSSLGSEDVFLKVLAKHAS